MEFNEFVEGVKNIGTIFGSGISIITFLALIIKPIRKRVIRWFVKVTHAEQIEMLDKEMNKVKKQNKADKDELNKRLDGVEKSTADGLAQLFEKIDDIADKVVTNEADRLRGELFNYGNRCRRGLPMYMDEFRYLQTIWKKYSEVLHENSIGEDEYKYIFGYFHSATNQEKINK